MKKILTLKKSARIKTNSEAVISVCEELAAQDNLNAKSLVDVSRPDEAPLHKEFEWNDSIAGEKYREHQARRLIRYVVIETPEVPKATPVRAYVNITAEKTGAYRPVDVVLSRPDSRAMLMRQARGDMEAFRAKYMSLMDELQEVFAAINTALIREG